MSRIAIVTPFHKPLLNKSEQMACRQYREVLGRYPRIVVVPQGLSTEQARSIDPGIEVEEFDPKWFASWQVHAAFCLSGELWARFAQFEFVLIAHYDSWAFEDQLEYWCGQGYPILGPAWLQQPTFLRRLLIPHCGGGGFSLRRVDWMSKACRRLRFAAGYLGRRSEDVAFCNRITRALMLEFSWPSLAETLRYGFESDPEQAFELNGRQLPFGCHGFNWPSRRKFWSRFIPELDPNV